MPKPGVAPDDAGVVTPKLNVGAAAGAAGAALVADGAAAV